MMVMIGMMLTMAGDSNDVDDSEMMIPAMTNGDDDDDDDGGNEPRRGPKRDHAMPGCSPQR